MRFVNGVLDGMRNDGSLAVPLPALAGCRRADRAAGPGVRTMTMTIADLDRDLERYRSAADTVSANLLELDGDPNRQLLETAPLTGTTAGEWADARTALTSVWDWFARFTTFLDRATELRVSPRTRLAPGRERALADFLSQPSIELAQRRHPAARPRPPATAARDEPVHRRRAARASCRTPSPARARWSAGSAPRGTSWSRGSPEARAAPRRTSAGSSARRWNSSSTRSPRHWSPIRSRSPKPRCTTPNSRSRR